MNQATRSTVSVQGSTHVLQRPSFLVLLGRIHASAPTLELALQNLDQKREAFSRWLKELSAENLEFGEPRFPDQVEPDPMRMSQQIAQQHMRRLSSQSLEDDDGKRSVLAGYTAQWPIGDKSFNEVLVFVDRIQFEASNLQESDEEPKEPTPSWQTDPMSEMQSVMSEMYTPEDGDEAHLLFLSSLTDSQHEEALAEAFRDGCAKADMTARAAGRELDDLKGAHWAGSTLEALQSAHEIQRRTLLPLLAETPFRAGPNQFVRESLRPAEFVVSIHLTFGLK